MICCICEGDIEVQAGPSLMDPTKLATWDKGHNAYPVKEGRCCGLCNTTVVIPKRIELMFGPKDAKKD